MTSVNSVNSTPPLSQDTSNQNTLTINPQTLPTNPSSGIEVSPIPVQSGGSQEAPTLSQGAPTTQTDYLTNLTSSPGSGSGSLGGEEALGQGTSNPGSAQEGPATELASAAVGDPGEARANEAHMPQEGPAAGDPGEARANEAHMPQEGPATELASTAVGDPGEARANEAHMPQEGPVVGDPVGEIQPNEAPMK